MLKRFVVVLDRVEAKRASDAATVAQSAVLAFGVRLAFGDE